MRVQSTSQSPCSLLLAITIAAGVAWPVAASAQRQRPTPPEPSAVAWITPQAEQDLQTAVSVYQRIVGAGGWPRFPDRITLRPGDSDASVMLLRQRLRATGDLGRGGGDSYEFDESLAEAVKRYQLRNGLEPNGVVYGITLRSLNVPAETRLAQLHINLGRMREAAARIAGAPKYIVMNAASFELQGISNGRVEVVSRTIAGKRTTPTPTVSAKVQAINLLPYWHVPGTIAKAALVPAVRKDPSYLYKERIRVYSTFGGEEIDPATVNWFGPEADRYVFRQDPGPHNALGVLRFDMPNKHIVYMHDTPMKPLFNYFERAYSAGCVRLQNFASVADWIITGQDGWNRASLDQAIASGQARTIKLAQAIPVHFVYLTSWVDRGQVQFRNDLYSRDEKAFDGGEDVAARTLTQSLAP